jgi:hypothetical protein
VPDMDSRLTRITLSLSTEWMGKTVTTDPPRLTPHEEWRLAVRLRAEWPFRLAVLVCSPSVASWGLKPGHGAVETEDAVHFFPHGWSTSDAVQVNFGWRRIAVVDRDLKADPRPHVRVIAPEMAATGEVVPVCEVSRHGIVVSAMALALQDTENQRGHRWRVRPKLASAIPDGLDVLASGRQSGDIDSDDGTGVVGA